MSVTNPVTVSFTAPVTYVDGTTMPANEVSKYQYGFGTTSGSYTLVVDDADLTVTAGKQTGALPTNLAVGNWFSAVRSVTKDGATSGWSNEFPFTVAAKVPSNVLDFSAA